MTDTVSASNLPLLARATEVLGLEDEGGGRKTLGRVATITANPGLVYTSRASLRADLAHPAYTQAWVLGDATAAYNGVYQKSGSSGSGSWTRVADLPYGLIIATDAGAGTANAIVATSSLPIATGALVALQVYESNTSSPVTVAFNGATAVAIKTNTGSDVAPGGLAAGAWLLGLVGSSTYQLISDQASAAIQAAAEAAQGLAEDARDAASAFADAAESVSDAFARVASVAGLKALNTSLVTTAYLTVAGRAGVFVWRAGNYAAAVAADPDEGIYIEADAVAATAGAWERVYNGEQYREWFGRSPAGLLVPRVRTAAPLYAQTLGWKYEPSGEAMINLGSGGFSVFPRYGFGSIWVARTDPPALLRINPQTGTITATISAGTSPGNSPLGLCISDKAVWMTDSNGGRVGRCDPATNTLIWPAGLTELGSPTRGIAWDGAHIWVTGGTSSGWCKRIDPATNTVQATVTVGHTPFYPAYDGVDHLWVPNWGADTVSRVNIGTDTVDSTIPTASAPWIGFCDGAYMYISEMGAASHSVARYAIGSVSSSARWSLDSGAAAHDLLVVDDELWCVQSGIQSIKVLHTHSGAAKKTITVGDDPAGLCFDGRDIWVVNALDNTMQRLMRKSAY